MCFPSFTEKLRTRRHMSIDLLSEIRIRFLLDHESNRSCVTGFTAKKCQQVNSAPRCDSPSHFCITHFMLHSRSTPQVMETRDNETDSRFFCPSENWPYSPSSPPRPEKRLTLFYRTSSPEAKVVRQSICICIKLFTGI